MFCMYALDIACLVGFKMGFCLLTPATCCYNYCDHYSEIICTSNTNCIKMFLNIFISEKYFSYLGLAGAHLSI